MSDHIWMMVLQMVLGGTASCCNLNKNMAASGDMTMLHVMVDPRLHASNVKCHAA
jgi:hypothetical protein